MQRIGKSPEWFRGKSPLHLTNMSPKDNYFGPQLNDQKARYSKVNLLQFFGL